MYAKNLRGRKGVGLGATIYASILNLNRPGATGFYVGEGYTVTITGAQQNAAVWLQSGHPGSTTQQQIGTTDGAGNFIASGTFTVDQVGQWQMVYSVNGVAAPMITAQVSVPPLTTGTTTPAVVSTGTDLTSLLPSFLTNTVMGYPVWEVLGVALLAWKFFGRRR